MKRDPTAFFAEELLEEELPLSVLVPSNDSLRKAFAVESEEALELCRQRGVPVPKESA